MTGFVLDCSVTMAWCFSDEFNDYASSVQDALQHTQARVPAIWYFEVANVLVVGERRARLTAEDSVAFLSLVARLPIEIVPPETADGMSNTLAIAKQTGFSAYDSAYIDLATRENVPLATLDKSVAAAAQAFGVQLFDPMHRPDRANGGNE
ncbi:MAG: type II toxin-antitoxin system VapC family toxin [Candidatus Hydrogenedentes bacterium]|nr:type II toxin-antitoxin system VapC family toxin [Candidatus Hydrogenedentota bacterium]